MFAVTLVFVVYNILLIPVCYVKLWWHKLIMIYVYSKSYRVSRADKFIVFVMFWGLGLITLSINTVVDVWYFLQHLWITDINKTQHKTNQEQLSKRNVNVLSQYFKEKQDKIMPYKDTATDIRTKFGVFNSILHIL